MLELLQSSGFHFLATILTVVYFRRLDGFMRWQGILVLISLLIDLTANVYFSFYKTSNAYFYIILWIVEFLILGKAAYLVIPWKNYWKVYFVLFLIFLSILVFELVADDFIIKRYFMIFSYFVQLLQYGFILFIFITSESHLDQSKIWLSIGLLIYFTIVPVFFSVIRTLFESDPNLSQWLHQSVIISASHLRYLLFCISLFVFIRTANVSRVYE